MHSRGGRDDRTTRRGGLALLATAVALMAAASPAGAATAAYPAGGSGFDGGAEGWAGSGAQCSLLAGLGLTCVASTTHMPDGGDPGGALATDVDVLVNLGGTFQGTGTWTSPPFTVDVDPVASVGFSYDRRFDAGGLLNLSPTSEIEVELVDQEGGTTATLLSESLSAGDSAFAPRAVGLSAATVSEGHTYRLRITTTTTSSQQSSSVFGTSSTVFDNVRLAVGDELSGGGGDPGGDGDGDGGDFELSPGVTIVHGSLTNVEIRNVMRRFSEHAESGDGPGGSLVPLEQCTIVGTPADDRIVGTAGNDVICGLGGDDVIEGAGGRDLIDGANGGDRLTGGTGGDLLLGLRGRDRLGGGAGHDRAGGGAGPDYLNGGKGHDRVSGGAGRDRVNGAAGRDVVSGRRGPDRMNGGPGRDRMLGGPGADVMNGRSGPDRMRGGPGRDRLRPGNGRDRVGGGAGPDRIRARDGKRDRVVGGRGRDRAVVDRRDRVRAVRLVRRR